MGSGAVPHLTLNAVPAYDLDDPLQHHLPLLVTRFAVVLGMVLMFARGKLLFKGCISNG